MAQSLLSAGHDVTVWNRSVDKTVPLVERGAIAAATPREAVLGAEFAICMVRDDPASREVWLDAENGALAALPKDAVAVDSSTLTVAWAEELAALCRRAGIAFLDAPVAGSRPQADAAQLIYLVGGEAGTLAKTEPVLKVMGSAVHHAGPAGSGTAVKLTVNALLGIQAAAMAELIGLLRRSGMDAARALEIVAATSVSSLASKTAAAGMLAGNFAPLFPVALVEKDLGYMIETAAAHGADLPVVQAARQVFAKANEAGYGEEQLTAAIKLYD